MKVFISNFGFSNGFWPDCLKHGVIATFEDEDLRPFWLQGNRDAYIRYAIAHKKTSAGITPTKSVASRWFNLASIVAETQNDVWVHREKDDLWWSISKPDPITSSLESSPKPERTGDRIYVLRKPVKPWSNKTKDGRLLSWRTIHPKAREFLFLEGTIQQLSEDNARYVAALIDGGDLSPWHTRATWLEKQVKSKSMPIKSYNEVERAAFQMTRTAFDTTARANGQKELVTLKNKEMRFPSEEAMRSYVISLLKDQEKRCAITAMPLHFDTENSNPQMVFSLDRIDSNGHYEEGNLQVVCRFINRWKSDSDDREFRDLLKLIKDEAVLE